MANCGECSIALKIKYIFKKYLFIHLLPNCRFFHPLLPIPVSLPLSHVSPHCPKPAPAHQVISGLNAFSPKVVCQGNLARRKWLKTRQQSQIQPLIPLLGDPHEDQADHQVHMCRGPRSSSCLVLCASVSKTLLGPTLLGSVGLFVKLLLPLGPSIFHSTLMQGALCST